MLKNCQVLSDGNTDAYVFCILENVRNGKQNRKSTSIQQRLSARSGYKDCEM